MDRSIDTSKWAGNIERESSLVWGMENKCAYTGQEAINEGKKHGWKVVRYWGRGGWAMGHLPYDIVFHKDYMFVGGEDENCFDLALYMDGKVTEFTFSTAEQREKMTDDLLFQFLKRANLHVVEDFESIDDVTDDGLRGPWMRR